MGRTSNISTLLDQTTMSAPMLASAMRTRMMLRAQPSRIINMQQRFMGMKPTGRVMSPVPKEEHSAHTISQRLRSLKKIPPELIPLGVVIGFALVIAAYSSVQILHRPNSAPEQTGQLP